MGNGIEISEGKMTAATAAPTGGTSVGPATFGLQRRPPANRTPHCAQNHFPIICYRFSFLLPGFFFILSLSSFSSSYLIFFFLEFISLFLKFPSPPSS